MFDVGAPEILLVAIVAIIVIGPKDLPVALRLAGRWVGKARAMMREVRSGFDAMVREAEMEEMEKKWAADNERIIRESGDTEMLPLPPSRETTLSDEDRKHDEGSDAETGVVPVQDSPPAKSQNPEPDKTE